jgi:hypothetical protein
MTRRAAYGLLILVAATLIGQRVLSAPARFSANDQSRWSTIRALVDDGTYAIGRRHLRHDGSYEDRGMVSERDWRTPDVIMHPNTLYFYSSKPALLPTVLAAEYWLLRKTFGWRMTENRVAVSRTILLTINWLPFVLYLVLFARLVERLGTTDWGRLFVMTGASLGTFVSAYLVTLNNHTVAATSALFAVYHCLRIHLDGDRRWWRFLLAGLFSGWMACNELPAASLAVALLVWLSWLSWRQTLRFALPALLLPIAVYLAIHYAVFGTIVPTYAQTKWYMFRGAYWRSPTGLDRAEDPPLLYAFHLLVGHTGILSLTPVLLLGWIGMVRGAAVRRLADSTAQALLGILTLMLTLVVFVFYVYRTNDYGGATAGARWFIWLTPLWLLTMLPEVDRWSSHRWLRRVGCGLLAASIASTAHAINDPWWHSWLFVFLQQRGMISYS